MNNTTPPEEPEAFTRSQDLPALTSKEDAERMAKKVLGYVQRMAPRVLAAIRPIGKGDLLEQITTDAISKVYSGERTCPSHVRLVHVIARTWTSIADKRLAQIRREAVWRTGSAQLPPPPTKEVVDNARGGERLPAFPAHTFRQDQITLHCARQPDSPLRTLENAETLAAILRQVEARMPGDDLALAYVRYTLECGTAKREDVAAALGVDPIDITNVKKRLKNKLKKNP